MKALRLPRWSASILTHQRRHCGGQYQLALSVRLQSSVSALQAEDVPYSDDTPASQSAGQPSITPDLTQLPSPLPEAALRSAKLSALHSRLSLSSRLPLETLARCLVDPSADSNPLFNNLSLRLLGEELFSYYTCEEIICRYPRLPISVLFAAMYAFVGSKALEAITREWGVEAAAEPGGEVDPGLLQAKRSPAGTYDDLDEGLSQRPNAEKRWRKTISSKTLYGDSFGDERTSPNRVEGTDVRVREGTSAVTLERASTNFARAVMGAVYLHGGRPAAKQFFKQHILSRELSIAGLFDFRQPTRDLSRLCAREGFDSPVARIISETGRKSRHPVFVVGVYSGYDKLGEGSGGSLDEARTSAAIAALKGWYLYSPLNVKVPSDDLGDRGKSWEPAFIDCGEVIV